MNLFNCAGFDCEKSDFVFLGVPFDKNHSYRDGSKDAPCAIRDASLEIETYLMDKDLDIEDLSICDLGDVELEDFSELFSRAKKVVGELNNKKLVVLGGDHSITFPFVSAFNKNFGNISVLSLDAHFDLRETYQESRDSNACVMRRVAEEIGFCNLFEIGGRSVFREDFIYARDNGISFIPYHEIRDNGLSVVDGMLKKIKGRLYLSVDIDIVDSSLAPGVENPEPEGITVQQLLELIRKIFRECDVLACDIVEVAPKYDNGITTAIAARTIFEILGEWALKKAKFN